MQEVPDISESETWVIRTTLQERYKEPVELQIADAEIRLHSSDRDVTSCPVWYWEWSNQGIRGLETDGISRVKI